MVTSLMGTGLRAGMGNGSHCNAVLFGFCLEQYCSRDTSLTENKGLREHNAAVCKLHMEIQTDTGHVHMLWHMVLDKKMLRLLLSHAGIPLPHPRLQKRHSLHPYWQCEKNDPRP